jgi:FkbM family methyltransferase
LERCAAGDYDLVIEIGANVGVYSVFFDALIKKHPDSRLKRIIAFEPAYEPFRRLLENIAVNKADLVTPFRAGIGDTSGFEAFFEPRGHLTNGSFNREFARIFTNEIDESVVLTCRAEELAYFFRDDPRVLLKIDVEGYEPTLIMAMQGVIGKYHPDLLIEVLPGTAGVLNDAEFLLGYERFLITPAGLEGREDVVADARHRDWLLKWKPGQFVTSRIYNRAMGQALPAAGLASSAVASETRLLGPAIYIR